MKARAGMVLSVVVLLSVGILLTGCGSSSKTNTPATKKLIVADSNNNRVLIFNAPFTTNQSASIVLGQPSLTTNTAGITASLTNSPLEIAEDQDGNVFVAEDGPNCRVMQFKAPLATGMAASVVLGQSGFTTSSCTASQTGLVVPIGLAFDSSGNLWVSDLGNRIVEYKPPFTNGMTASLVLGQADFTSSGANRGGAIAANTLNSPRQLKFDGSGNLWVADSNNSRVLRYTPPFSNGMAASLVIGQTSFTTGTSSATASTVYRPNGLAFDSEGNLWVADWLNSRVLQFKPPFSNGMAASLVVGQANFTSGGIGLSSSAFNYSSAVAFDSSGNLIVVDEMNHRTLIFQPPFTNGMAATTVIGQTGLSIGAMNQGGSVGANTLNVPFAVVTSSK